jgi:hypothetical protein
MLFHNNAPETSTLLSSKFRQQFAGRTILLCQSIAVQLCYQSDAPIRPL